MGCERILRQDSDAMFCGICQSASDDRPSGFCSINAQRRSDHVGSAFHDAHANSFPLRQRPSDSAAIISDSQNDLQIALLEFDLNFARIGMSQRIAQRFLGDVEQMRSCDVVFDQDGKLAVERAAHARLQLHPFDQVRQSRRESLRINRDRIQVAADRADLFERLVQVAPQTLGEFER